MYAAHNKTRFYFIFLVILLGVLSPFMTSTVASAAEPLAFAGSPPQDALENEDYSWQIVITGGKAPYSCNITGALPPGLFLDAANWRIYGKPPRGTAIARYAFNIKATDSSNPRLSIESPFIINVQYRSTIAATPALSGETNVYVDGQQVATLRGGEKIDRIFPAGTKHTITVDNQGSASGKDGIRLKPIVDKIVVDGLSPDATFDYSSEYEIRIKSNQPDIPSVPGSGWYKTGDLLDSTAPAQIDPKQGIQYRFAHWLLPTGEVLGNTKLNWKIAKQGDVTAVYDTYYLLTVTSEYCDVEGADWYKAGTKARWHITCSQAVPVPGFWGNLGVELKPDKDTGTVLMDGPQEINITWRADYSRLVIPTVTGIIVAVVLAIFGLLHERSKHVVTKIKEKRASRSK